MKILLIFLNLFSLIVINAAGKIWQTIGCPPPSFWNLLSKNFDISQDIIFFISSCFIIIFVIGGSSCIESHEENLNYKRDDEYKIDTIYSMTSYENCQKECRETPKCKFWTYHISEGNCHLLEQGIDNGQSNQYFRGTVCQPGNIIWRCDNRMHNNYLCLNLLFLV